MLRDYVVREGNLVDAQPQQGASALESHSLDMSGNRAHVAVPAQIRPHAGRFNEGLPIRGRAAALDYAPIADTEARGRREPARAGVPVGVARRVRVGADGADAAAGRAHGRRARRAGHRHRQASTISPRLRKGAFSVIAFVTANYVARETGYAMHGFPQGARLTNEAFAPIETYADRFDALLADIRALGFDTIDLWSGHLNPEWETDAHVEAALDALARRGIRVSTYAPWITAANVERACELTLALGTSVIGQRVSPASRRRSSPCSRSTASGSRSRTMPSGRRPRCSRRSRAAASGAGTSSDRSRRARADPSDGQGEPQVGHLRIKGELLKLGITVSATTIANARPAGATG